jgi:AcrR family transcriptional regulator
MVQVLNRDSKELVPDRARRKSEAKRLDILRAAARVFRRLGLSATGMREIAQEADLSPGNLYYYFAGKDEILLYCQERTVGRLLAEAARASATAGAYADRLRALMSAHVHCMLDDLEGTTAHLEVEGLPERMRRGIIAKRDAYEHAVRELVVAGMKRGEFAKGDASLVTRAMLGAVNWTARWYRHGGAQSVAEVADALADYLVRGLLRTTPAR